MRIKKAAVIGLGYIGLPTLVAISKTNLYKVVGFDVDVKKINLIKNYLSPIEDGDVELWLKENRVNVSNDENILKNSDVFIICVPTPVFDNNSPDYSYIEKAIKTIVKFLKKGSHVVLESTVNPGTCREVIIPMLKSLTNLKIGKDYNLAHCPERLSPGDKKWNIYNINRNIGSINKTQNKKIAAFYQSFIKDAKINQISSLEIAEATKIIENTFRDINIAYINELAKSFDALGIDLYETIKAASTKPFGFMPHWPGCGVGGHCIAVDPYYLIDRAQKSGFNHSFLRLAREINNSMPEYTIEKLINQLNNLRLSVKNTKILLLGLTYKPNVSDIRNSPALEIKKRLLELGAKLKIYDPFVKSDFKSLKSALKYPTVIIIATSHSQFRKDIADVLDKTKVKIVIDGRNCLDKEKVMASGIIYKGIGR